MELWVTSMLDSQLFCWFTCFPYFVILGPVLYWWGWWMGSFPQQRLGFWCVSFSLHHHGHQPGWNIARMTKSMSSCPRPFWKNSVPWVWIWADWIPWGEVRLSATTLPSCRTGSQAWLFLWTLFQQHPIQSQNFSVPGKTLAQCFSIILGSVFNGWVGFQPFNSLNSRNFNCSQESVHWLRKKTLLLLFPKNHWQRMAAASIIC